MRCSWRWPTWALALLLLLLLLPTTSSGASAPAQLQRVYPQQQEQQQGGWVERTAAAAKAWLATNPLHRQIFRKEESQERPHGGHNCTTNATCHHGTCVKRPNATADEEAFCVCDWGYMGETCNYEQKSLKTAFCLSFLLGNLGADRLYLGYVGSGVTKLLLNLILCILPCCPLCYMCGSQLRQRQIEIGYIITVGSILISAATVWLWWLIVRCLLFVSYDCAL